MDRWRRRGALLALAMLTIGCDRATKHFAAPALMRVPRQSFLGDTLRLEYAENRRAFLSLGEQLPEPIRSVIFTYGTGLALAALAVLGFRQRSSALNAAGWTLVLAGGLSNLIDRVAHGNVVDFLNVGVGPVRTGIFNLADLAITAGIVLVALSGNSGSRKEHGCAH